MERLQHTPGPWSHDVFDPINGFQISEYNGRHHRALASTFGDPIKGREEANARLIAAAPELFLVAEMQECLDTMEYDGAAIEFLEAHGYDKLGAYTPTEWVREHRKAAIAKAIGCDSALAA